MVQISDGFDLIGYEKFQSLLNEGVWSLCIGIKDKDKWDVERHLGYIDSLMRRKSNLTVQFYIDNKCLTKAEVLDVYIGP
mgnify:FL=1